MIILNQIHIIKLTFFEQNINEINLKSKYFFDEFILGIKLKSYIFDKYKSKKNKNFEIEYFLKTNRINFNKNKRFNSLIEGSNFTKKDLVSEPGNILHPDEYAQRLKKLNKLGLKVTVYDKKKIKKDGNVCFTRSWARKC